MPTVGYYSAAATGQRTPVDSDYARGDARRGHQV